MDSLKRFFITPYLLLLALTVIYGGIGLLLELNRFHPAHPLAETGMLLAAAAPLGFFLWLLFARPPRTSQHPIAITLLCGAGVVVVMLAGRNTNGIPGHPFWLAAAAFTGWYLYLRWYSRWPQTSLPHLKPGHALPAFELHRLSGEIITSGQLRERAHILIFFRGNWCIFCTAQIRELAARWRTIAHHGAQVILISPQPAKHMAQLAKQFNIPFQFMIDRGNRAAQRLGIAAPGSLPLGMELQGYPADAARPTVIISDQQGVIRFAHITDNYRVRPDPDSLLAILNRID